MTNIWIGRVFKGNLQSEPSLWNLGIHEPHRVMWMSFFIMLKGVISSYFQRNLVAFYPDTTYVWIAVTYKLETNVFTDRHIFALNVFTADTFNYLRIPGIMSIRFHFTPGLRMKSDSVCISPENRQNYKISSDIWTYSHRTPEIITKYI